MGFAMFSREIERRFDNDHLTVKAEPIALRAYQTACVEKCRAAFAHGKRAVLLVSPTGSGKTIIFCAITSSARSRGKRLLLVVHRRELLKQASAKLLLAGVPQVSSPQALYPTLMNWCNSVLSRASSDASVA